MAHKNPFFFPSILALSSISFFATDIYLPSFPAIQSDFQTLKSSVQLSFSLYLATWSLSQLFYGPFSDKIGRRKVVIGSLSFGFIGTLVCLFAPNITMLILGRILQGLGLGGSFVLFRSILRDSYSGDTLAHYASFIGVATAIFMAVAPSIGGYIQDFLGWRACFLFIALYTLGLLLAVLRFVPETNQHINPDAMKKKILLGNYFHLLKNPLFLGYALCSCLAFGGFSAYLTASPFLFEQVLKLSPVQYGWLAWIFGAGFGVGGLFNVLLVKKMGRHRSLVVGIVLVFLSGVLMLILSLFGFLSVWAIMIPMGIFALGAAPCFANSFAGAFQPFGKMAGAAGALFGCLQALGGSLTSALMSQLKESSQTPLAIVIIVVGISCYFAQYWVFSYAKKKLLGD